MVKEIKNLSKNTFGGRTLRKQQITDIQTTVKNFPALSRRELAHTICEHLKWTTPRGIDKIQTCLNAMDEMELRGIISLPSKIKQKKKVQKKIQWSDRTNEAPLIDCALNELMPISLQVVTEKEEAEQWNEFVDRYHYLSYRRPIGSYLRYYIIDRNGRKLGCLLFSFASVTLPCRDEWIGWSAQHRQKHLNLVINNNRFLIFPWVNVKHLASKALSYAVRQIGDDWEAHHGYRPVLVETFVDPTKYTGTCYKASNWQHIGKSAGCASTNEAEKDVYVYPLDPDAREALMDKKKSPSTKVDPYKTANIPSDSQVYLWQKIITVVASVAENFDKEWQKRKRVITTLLIILFIFRLVFSKNKQGYGSTIAELWEYCAKLNIPLPQPKPVVPATFCNARKKLDETIFKTLNTEIIRTYETDREDHHWKNHRLFAVDGSKINLPRQLLEYGYKTPWDKAHYPQGLVSCLYQLKSKTPVDFDLSSQLDERKMALNHFDALKKDDIVVYDRGYFSYIMLHAHHKKGIHAIFRLQTNAIKEIDEFMSSPDMERIIIVDPTLKRQKQILQTHPDAEFIPIQLRLIKYVIDGVMYILGTTLIDSQKYRADEFADIYHSRWGIEELYKISKVLVDVEDFHGQTERGVKQELFAHFVIITLSRIFANQTNDVLLLTHKSSEPEKMKTNIKNCLITMARNLECLFLQQAVHIKERLTIIINSITTCYQKERLNRSYTRKSQKIVNKWRSAQQKGRGSSVTAVAV